MTWDDVWYVYIVGVVVTWLVTMRRAAKLDDGARDYIQTASVFTLFAFAWPIFIPYILLRPLARSREDVSQ